MTWNTPTGERILKGAEAELFIQAIEILVSQYEDDLDIMYGGDPPEDARFDSFDVNCGEFTKLNGNQRYTVLDEVVRALLKDSETCPEHNHMNEAAIYFVFSFIKFTLELYGVEEHPFGDEIKAAFTECYPPPPPVTKVVKKRKRGRPPKKAPGAVTDEEEEDEFADCRPTDNLSEEAWSDAIERLQELVLWDTDFLMSRYFCSPDEDSEDESVKEDTKVESVKEAMGIAGGYYSLKQKDIVAAPPGAGNRLLALCEEVRRERCNAVND